MSASSKSHEHEPPMTCASAQPYLSAYADGELVDHLRQRVDTHIAGCEACALRVAKIRALDQALAALPHTTPSPEVFERVHAAIANRTTEPAMRESLGAGLRLLPRRHRQVNTSWTTDDTPTAHLGRAPRHVRWTSGVIPTIAAVLLIAVTAVAFRGVVNSPLGRGSDHPTPTVAPETALQLTQRKVASATALTALAFTPVLPTYLPDNVQGVNVNVSSASADKPTRTLDVTWTLDGAVRNLHLRESAADYVYPDYKLKTDLPNLSWQVTSDAWRPVVAQHGPQYPAVTQLRAHAGVSIVLEGQPQSSDMTDNTTIQTLQLVSMSMDTPFHPITIKPTPIQNRVLHFSTLPMPFTDAPGWTQDAYIYPAQDLQRVDVTTRDGRHYVDITRGGQDGIRLDETNHTYTVGTRDQLSGKIDTGGPWTQFFVNANLLVQAGYLWDSGHEATWGGLPVYDFIYVTAPYRTHVYVDKKSSQVVQMWVDLNDKTNPDGVAAPDKLIATDKCRGFTKIEYLQPGQEPTPNFYSTTPPSGYQPGRPPTTVSCAG